jgi:hypothetical protein
MSRHFNALAAVVEGPDLPVDDLPQTDADECRLVTVGWNETNVDVNQDVWLHQLLEG